MRKKEAIMLAAGGTGGHLFPAISLAKVLIEQHYEVYIITDRRAQNYIKNMPEISIHLIDCATLKRKNPFALVKMLWYNVAGLWQARKFLKIVKPFCVIGFGGYPTIPPLLAACSLKIPTLIHEQNAVMGRANKFLAPMVDRIAGGFLLNVAKNLQKKFVVTGNPLRAEVLEAAKQPYRPYNKENREEKFRLLIFGGSQGASFFNEVFPKMFALFDKEERAKISLVQQSRGQADELKTAYKNLAIDSQIAPFFEDMPKKIAEAHFIIARSGASTVSEISAIGRPALLVPYPYALDHDQAANAEQLAKAGGALLRQEASLNEANLAQIVREAIHSPERLAQQASNAKITAKINAVDLLLTLIKTLKEKQHD